MTARSTAVGTVTGLSRGVRELKEAARSLHILTDYLESHPEALIQGKKAAGATR